MRAQRKTNPTPAQGNIDSVITVEKEALDSLSIGERVSNVIARFAGSIGFAILHILWFGIWCLINTGWVSGIAPFDPFPFSLLTMLVSLEAIFLSIFVLINQNVMSRQADHRTHLDLQVNLLAEQESTWMLEMMRRLCQHLGVQVEDVNMELEELTKKTDIQELIGELKDKLPTESTGNARSGS